MIRNPAKNYYLLLLFLFLCTSCRKSYEKYDIKNLNNGDITILGHTGMGELYKLPGNTFESISTLFSIGAEGTEVDIQMTKDSILVLFHNDQMNLRTNCSGCVHDFNYAEIGACTYRGIEQNIYIITLENLFQRIPNLQNYIFSFDCKIPESVTDADKYSRTMARAIQRIGYDYNMTSNIIIEGNIGFLLTIRDEGLINKIFLTQAATYTDAINQAIQIGADGIGCDGRNITHSEVAAAHANNLMVMAWGGTTKAETKLLIRKNVDIIQSDKPIFLLKVFKRYKP